MKKSTYKKLSTLLENTGDMALKRRAKKIIEELNPKNRDKVLEVGCGDGYYLFLLSNLGIKFQLTGVDIDENALKSARNNLMGKNIKLIQSDLMKGLPFKDNTFNKIIMSEVCEHLSDDSLGLKEVRRVLKKDGILIVTVPNHNYPFLWDPVNWFLEHFFNRHIREGMWSGLWSQHFRLYEPQEINKVVEKAGFRVSTVESLTFWCIPFNHNIVYLTAKSLHSGKMSTDTVGALNKFQNKNISKPFLIGVAFRLVNLIDKLNDIYQPRRSGVGVLVTAVK